MKALGFTDVFEVAIGADLCATQEAIDFLEEVPEKLPFMATSCCPAWSVIDVYKRQEMDMAGMIFLGLVLAGLAGYLVYALVYPEKL